MRSQIFLCLWFLSWALVLVGCDNVYTVERIAKEGINFREVADRLRLNINLNISTGCNEQIVGLFDENEQAFWQMIDAWSKFPYPGAFYYASHSDWGNYDECIKVDVKHDGERILGKFCAWGWVLPDTRPNETTPYFTLSYCVPEKCTADDLKNIFFGLPIFNDNFCSTKDTDRQIDTGAIVTIVVFLFIFLWMVLSTAYDVYLHYAQKKSPSPLYTAFSVYTNGKKLLQSTRVSHGGEQVLCFQGMKFISMWWIISGHGLISWMLAPTQNKDERGNWQSKRYTEYIATAHISVDTFFYISGFLMAYLYFKQEISKKPIWQQVKVVPSMILHRYLRLTPANGMCFLGSVYLYKYLQNGPFFSYAIHTGLIEPCQKYWWTYFLYIQNYYNFHFGDSLCIPTTWYLSADMQLFLITPLFIIPLALLYRRSLRDTLAVLLALNLIFMAIPIFTKLHWRTYDPDFLEYDFHSKLISYFIGVMMGIYMRHEKQKKIVIGRSNNEYTTQTFIGPINLMLFQLYLPLLNLHTTQWRLILNIVLWIIALGTMLSVMFYREQIQLKNEYVSRSLCYSFTRPMWCLALSWITFSCVHGYGGIVNWFLSSSFMQFGGKLTYCLYIVHGMVIAHFSLGVKNRLYFSDWHAFYQNCGYFIVSILVATFWTLAFESPMITIERMIFGGSPRPVKRKSENQNANETKAA